MYEEKCLKCYDNTEDVLNLAQKVEQLCKLMITEFDTIRHKYWEYVAAHFRIQFNEILHNKQNEATSV